MTIILKNKNGDFYALGGAYATNKHGEPVDGDGQTLDIQTGDDAIKAVYGDLHERVSESYREAVRSQQAAAEKSKAAQATD